MAKNKGVALPVIRRLPRYYRFISGLIAAGVDRISSRELSERMGLTASQIRQDLNCFGSFGQQGYGYNLQVMRQEIGKILGLNACLKTVLVGAGNMGRAVGSRMNFADVGFELVGIFDVSSDIIGQKISALTVQDAACLESFCIQNQVTAAIVCVPDENAGEVVRRLVDSGVRNFWNFTHYDILMNYPEHTLAVENVHLNDSLMTLRFLAKNGKV